MKGHHLSDLPSVQKCAHVKTRTSLVADWVRIHLLMQGTGVQSLVWEDFACRGATKPLGSNYWACELQLLKPACLESVLSSERSHRNSERSWCIETQSRPHFPQVEESLCKGNEDPAQPKIKINFNCGKLKCLRLLAISASLEKSCLKSGAVFSGKNCLIRHVLFPRL